MEALRSMTDRGETLFRAEALEHRAQAQTPGNALRVGPRWTRWAFWALLVLVIAAIAAASLIDIERYATGTTAADDEGRVVVLVPAALAPDVATGRPVTIGEHAGKVVSSGGELLYPPDVKDRYGVDVAVPSVALVTSTRAADTMPGTARVLVESEPAIVALIPGLKGLLGE
jgi:hypothetical protein